MTEANALVEAHLQFTHPPPLPKIAKELLPQPHRGQLKAMSQKKKCTGIQHGLRKHRGSVVFGSSELLDRPPIQNFDNEKSKVNYKNIWLG